MFLGNNENKENVLIRSPEVIWSGLEAIFGNLGAFSVFSGKSENNENVLIRPPEVICSGLEAIFGNWGAFSVFLGRMKITKMF